MSHADSPIVLVALPSGDFLALSQEQFEEARALGAQLAGPTPKADDHAQEERLLTAEQMEERTGIPASWFLEQARKDAIAHVRLGKYRRFQLSKLQEAGAQRRKMP